MPDARRILALDHNKRNLALLAEFLAKAGHTVTAANSLPEMDAALQGDPPVDLALIDLAGFDSRVWERCDRLRQRHIPFLVISPQHRVDLERASLSRGAKGMLVKPLSAKSLLGLVQSLLPA
ncbi:MAG: response regulator [Verrucomicrobia bacterium]|nr:response regulator [Verrucomicrobiota bacterium]